ncbi:MAG TPA: hypothetical protein PLA10_02565 [Clostridiales bacterium]|jgi:hypothetical protein|nr:hypothetical protein [Clostridiales bacterium]
MRINDDSDIKIFGEKKKKDDFDPMLLLEEIKRHRSSGNTAKAKTIAHHMADSIVESDIDESVKSFADRYEVELTSEVMHQVRVLSVFSAEYVLNKYLPSPLLSSVAINELYESILAEAPEFYDRLESGTAFTFYYLAVRSGGNTPAEIGKAFASQCGREDDGSCALFGTAVFTLNVEIFQNLIFSFNFEE